MNKENKSAAGLRRSAIAERIRLREEWSELKGRQSQLTARNDNVIKKLNKIKTAASGSAVPNIDRIRKPSNRNSQKTDNILCGVVALVEVGSEGRALPLRAALAALGATVLPAWSPLVTHLVWTQGGCRSTRARARALACRLVSPLWVEACAAASRRLPEQAFPAAARPSDLPSPRTLQRLLKKADMENIPISVLLSDSADENGKQLRLRMSSDTDGDTSGDTSRDTSGDTSKDTTMDTTDEGTGVKAQDKAVKRAEPMLAPPDKPKRKLFTQKETAENDVEHSGDEGPVPKPRKPSYQPAPGKQKPPPQESSRRQLERAQRLAKRIVTGAQPPRGLRDPPPRIVLTGMCRTERRLVSDIVRGLKGRLLPAVDKTTTHVVVGTFLPDRDYNLFNSTAPGRLVSGHLAFTVDPMQSLKPRTLSALAGAARGCRVVRAQWTHDSGRACRWLYHAGYEVEYLKKLCEKARLERSALGQQRGDYAYDVFCGMRVRMARAANRCAALHLLDLCGAVVQDVGENGEQASQNRAPTQNAAVTQNGSSTQNGGVTQNGGSTQNGGVTQNGGATQNGGRRHTSDYYVTRRPDREYDVKIGSEDGDVSSRWVFDSVAAGRMRNTRRYIVERFVQARLERELAI